MRVKVNGISGGTLESLGIDPEINIIATHCRRRFIHQFSDMDHGFQMEIARTMANYLILDLLIVIDWGFLFKEATRSNISLIIVLYLTTQF
jgi:hypothetical protein